MIGAVHDLDHAPIGRDDIVAVTCGMALPEPSARGAAPAMVIAGSAGLTALAVGPDRPPAGPPSALVSDGTLHIALDGTIANRSTLIAELSPAPPPADISSTELILLAYRRWGCRCVERLSGNFAFLLWDTSRRRLLAARDPLGVHELFYRLDGRRILFGSRIAQLTAGPAYSPVDLDEEYMADFLATQVSVGDRTPFKSIRRLGAGHYLRAEGGSVSMVCYWDLDDRVETGCRRPDHYAERFRELFEEAVRTSLTPARRVCAELSGGLDSSAITAMAAHVLEREPRLTGPLSTLTLTFPETPDSDESAWAGALLDELGLPGHRLPCDDSFFDGAEDEARLRNEPHFGILCFPMLRREADYLAAAGVDVLLSGCRAEAVVLDAMPPLHLSDHLRSLSLGRLLHGLRAWQPATGESYLNLFAWCCLRPIVLPDTSEFSIDHRRTVQPWIDGGYARRMDLLARVRSRRTTRKFRSAAVQHQYETIKRSEQMIQRGSVEWSLEVRYPFLHRPLVEFCFAAPWEIKHQPGRHKALLRAGLAGILPERIRQRMSWASPTAAAFRAFRRRWTQMQDLARTSILADLGIFDRTEWERALTLARHGHSDNFVALTSCIAFEYWLRAHFGARG